MLSGFDGLRFSHWHPEIRDDGVVVLSLDRQDSSVNAMSQDVLLELGDLLERIALDPPKGVVVQSLKKAGFIAGADLKEFQEFDRRGHCQRRDPSWPGDLSEAGRAALPHRCGDPRPLPGRRHRTGAGLPLPRGVQ
ncbi:hypothetical protein ROV93_21465 [Stenotrophomonas maltophilia group sp. msm4]|uniref:hypothetical protein n=1 Tax=Stenotrophomonas maltophilia group sp. msm4 TaxID=3061100 RepID=UPI002895A2AB|nr:hypothetical protein [Stenotrophomonas maltophilia group sp. msm4]MDT3492687.1 hypothetical protein [Stenotrophomonas maltophilia group sp. msm4]